MPDPITMKTLLEAGCHFGHQTRRWNPKMEPYIFTARNGIHILDLAQTVDRLEAALQFIGETANAGSEILFVGTKKQAQDIVRSEAERCQMPWVVNRWLGGMLTNWQTIQARIDYLLLLERREERGDLEALPKRETLKIHHQMERLRRFFGGVREMKGQPSAVFIVDVPKERIAVQESVRLSIPTVAICDTNCDPLDIDYPIPSNDDAIRAIRLITTAVADAVIEGRAAHESAQADLAAEMEEAAAPSGVAEPSPAD